MTNELIKQLEKELWEAADQLRANSKLTAAEYKDPVLGLILLRFAQNRYEEAKVQVEASILEGPRGKRASTKEDFTAAGAIMLPEESKYDYLANLPESKDEIEERPFIAALVGEETTFVTETGTVEIRTVEGRFEGTFDLDGWTMSDAGRRDGVKVTGVFNALKVDD